MEAKNDLYSILVELGYISGDESFNDPEKFKDQLEDMKQSYFKSHELLTKENLEKVKCIAIYGDIGEGKTALAYKIIEILKGKTVYFMKHPKPYLIEPLGYKNLNSLEELERLQDVIVYWDEPQLTVPIYDKKTNRVIAKVCSLARQTNTTLIISSSDTRVFTKHNESYFDLWLIKDVDYEMVKNGSKIKKAIRNNCTLEPEGFRLERNEFVSESRKLIGFNGKHTFKLPKMWSEEHSKPYRNGERNNISHEL